MSPLLNRERGASRGGAAEGGLLLAAWDRYGLLLDEQMEVLDAAGGGMPDLVRFTEVARRRSRLADEIDALAAPFRRVRFAGLDAPALQARMTTCRLRDRAIVARLGELRDGTAQALRTLDARRPGREGYLARFGTTSRDAGARFDVRS